MAYTNEIENSEDFLKVWDDAGKPDKESDEYKALLEKYMKDHNNKEDNKEEEKPQDLNIGNGDNPQETGENSGNATNGEHWQKWAKNKGYLLDENKEEGFDYSFTIYKDEETRKNNTPLVAIKQKGNIVSLASDCMEVYQELAKDAKEKGYKRINFLESLSEQQQKMLLVACISNGIDVKNAPKSIDLNDDLLKGADEKTIEAVKQYNQKQQEAEISEHMKNSPNKPYPVDIKDNTAAIKKIMTAQKLGAKVETNGFLKISSEEIKKLPAMEKPQEQALIANLQELNKNWGQKLANGVEKTLDEYVKQSKEGEVKPLNIAEINPERQAVFYAVAKLKKIPMENVPDKMNTSYIQYMPDDIKTEMAEYNYERRKKQIAKMKEEDEQKDPDTYKSREEARAVRNDKSTSKKDRQQAIAMMAAANKILRGR